MTAQVRRTYWEMTDDERFALRNERPAHRGPYYCSWTTGYSPYPRYNNRMVKDDRSYATQEEAELRREVLLAENGGRYEVHVTA